MSFMKHYSGTMDSWNYEKGILRSVKQCECVCILYRLLIFPSYSHKHKNFDVNVFKVLCLMVKAHFIDYECIII